MRVWIVAAAVLAASACSQPAPAPQPAPPEPAPQVNAPSGQYALDGNHTTVTVRVNHFGLSNYTLRFNRISGTLNFNADAPAQSTIEATVDTTSLDTPFPGGRDFDAELQNSEWLDSATFPQATFRSTSVESTGPATANVTGDLTIHGQTHPATFEVTYNASHSPHPMGMQVSLIGFSAKTTILRSQYGLTTLLPASNGGNGVSDEAEIVIEAEFTRPIENAPATNAPLEPVN